MEPQSLAVHAGDRRALEDYIPVSTPLYASSSFFYRRVEDLASVFAGRRDGEVYARHGNPSVRALEAQVTALEAEADCACATASDTAGVHLAIAAALVERRQAVLAARALRASTLDFLDSVLRPSGVEVAYCDFLDADELERQARAFRPAALLVETISNPVPRVADLDRVSEVARAHEALLLVDNTPAPLIAQPFRHRADMVIYSAAGYLSGHGDTRAGIVLARAEHDETLHQAHECFGINLGPVEAFLVMRGVKTLPLRMRRHCANARVVAEALSDHPALERIVFPGHCDHPDSAAIQRLLPRGQSGGVVAIDVRGGEAKAQAVLKGLRLVSTTSTDADLATHASHPASTTHRRFDLETQRSLGISEGLIQIAIGAEDVEDILADLKQALAAA